MQSWMYVYGPIGLFVAVDSRCFVYTRTQMWTASFVEEDGASMVSLNGSPCGRQEDRVGTPSESSCPSAQFQMTLMQQNQLFHAELFKKMFENEHKDKEDK